MRKQLSPSRIGLKLCTVMAFLGLAFAATDVHAQGFMNPSSGAFVPMSLPVGLTDTTVRVQKTSSAAMFLGMGASMCSLASVAIGQGALHSQGGDILDAADDALANAGDRYMEGDDETVRSRANSALWNSLAERGKAGAGMCQDFLKVTKDKDGNETTSEGKWSKYVWGALAENDFWDSPEKMPRDIQKVCPGFSNIAKDKNELAHFKLFMFAALSHPESGCNAGVPNGGLFQMDAPACARVGMHVDAQALSEASVNTSCAVKVFAREMDKRGNLFANCSNGCPKGEVATYWAGLRNNPASAGDARAHNQFMNTIQKYPGCDGSAPATPVAEGVPTS